MLDSDLYWCRQSFTMHLVRLMTSWAVVCNVWYLEPQTLREGETPIEFSERCTSCFPTTCLFCWLRQPLIA